MDAVVAMAVVVMVLVVLMALGHRICTVLRSAITNSKPSRYRGLDLI